MTRLTIIGLALIAAAAPVLAVDGGIGRTIAGTWIVPSIGVVGPDSGFSFTSIPIGYMGAIGGSRLDPVGGTLVTDDRANAALNIQIPAYVYKTHFKKVSFSTMFMMPFNWWRGTGSTLSPNGVLESHTSANASIGDVVAIPLTVGIHFTPNNNLAFSTWFWAPTGLWRPGNLSNVGMGVWTVMPNFGHTYFWKAHSLQFDNFVGFDIYTHNDTTNYGSGTVFHWESMVIKYFRQKKVGVGALGTNITQITRDTGPLADSLNGFQGQLSAVGPIVVYTARAAKPSVNLQVRWLNSFFVSNMLKANIWMGGLSFSWR